MNLENYQQSFEKDNSSPRWAAINTRLDEFYPDGEPDEHWGTLLSYRLGGGDPLEGISVYQNNDKKKPHYHYVSYGFSELFYNEKAVGGEFSKFGFELTFRLIPYEDDEDNPIWVASMMQNIAKYVFSSGNYFDDFHYMPANSPIRLDTETDITALAFITDAKLGEINSPHGKVKFLQMVGITQKEFDHIINQKLDPKELLSKLQKNNPLLITDLKRKSII